jgi:putative ABC transport system permease protein
MTQLWLLQHVIGGYARLHPLRVVVQVVAIAIGVTLGYAVHLINTSALAEFSAAVRQTSGQADATVAGSREGFAEDVYARVAADPAVQAASPVLEVDAALVEPARLRGRLLTVVGVDALQAGRLAPQWVGEPPRHAADDGATGDDATRFALLRDGLFLSPAAQETLQLKPGDAIGVQVGSRLVTLTVAGSLPRARAGQVVAAMDLAYAQWRLDRLGVLTRIDLGLAPGARTERLAAAWSLPAGVAVATTDDAQSRVSNVSRAYRVNLNVLALVALFTGAFLVYSLQAQAVLARRTQLAFLRVIGTTRRQVANLLLLESAVLGVVGSALGIALGMGVAAAALSLLGGDLGSGFFTGVKPDLVVDPLATLGFFALGVLAACVGGALPARAAAALPPALALRSGSGLDHDAAQATAWPALALLLLAAVLLALPPLAGIPLGAYLAIAVLLVAAIGFKPLLAPWLFTPLAARLDGAGAPWWLATRRLAATPRFAAMGAAGIVASFALMVAMATMVASFRVSVDQWLARVLPADVYVQAGPVLAGGPAATTATFSERDLHTLAAHPGVARTRTTRTVKLVLDPQRAAVSLIIRPLALAAAESELPLAGRVVAPPAGAPPPVWVSEAMVDLYGARPGRVITLPLAGRAQPVFVAGVWRDYARQFGAIVIDSDDHLRLVGDTAGARARTEAQLWLAPGANARQVMAELAPRLDTQTAQFIETHEIRALSLRIFDRSFAVTYVLEIAAIVIGLVGIAATFSAQAIARTREFGMLRHLGVTRREVLALLAIEGLLVTALAIVIGLAAGLLVAWVLVDIVNPQSFHWTMDFRVPLALVGGLIVALLAASALTAVVAGRRAVAPEAVLAVREDW